MSWTLETKLRVTMSHGRVLYLGAGRLNRETLASASPYLKPVTDYGPPRPCTCCPWHRLIPQEVQIRPADISVLEEVKGCWMTDQELSEAESAEEPCPN